MKQQRKDDGTKEEEEEEAKEGHQHPKRWNKRNHYNNNIGPEKEKKNHLIYLLEFIEFIRTQSHGHNHTFNCM